MSTEDTFITKLINETYTESVEKDQPNSPVDLRKYFEKRLNEVDFNSVSEYLSQHHLSHQVLSYEEKSCCYRLNFKQFVLDFPSNWSIFKEISNADFIYLDQSTDQDFLLDIFSEICGSTQNILLIKEDLKVKLVFLPEENSLDHMDWMNNYYRKKQISNQVERKIA